MNIDELITNVKKKLKKNINMNKLIIDAANDKIFLMVINNDNSQKITHENSKVNYEKLTLLIIQFLESIDLNLNKITRNAPKKSKR